MSTRKKSLYILGGSPLSGICTVNTFFQSVADLFLQKHAYFNKPEANSLTLIRSLAPGRRKPVVSVPAQRRLLQQGLLRQMPCYIKAGSCYCSSCGPQSVQRCSYVLGTWMVSWDTLSHERQDSPRQQRFCREGRRGDARELTCPHE